ncbi:MAG: hypothetical protein A3J75_06440 [Acidobacteria bacterium RBG_16_68_9]|nr:MAG: hypothetical protein A3J75_06440 [Acidobacteria bacterium RBG_16_68_9]
MERSSDTVLVVDGRCDRLQVTQLVLQQEGYEVRHSRSATEAFDLFVRERAAVALVDEQTLSAGGADLIHQMRLLDPALPIILQSERTDAQERRRLVGDLGLHGVHHAEDRAERLLEMVASAISATRRSERMRADQELRGLILAKLCHDLRTSMHVIHGYTEILRADLTTGPVEDVLARLARASDGALDLIQSYLDLACLDAPGVVVRRELVSVDDVVKELCVEAARLVGHRPVRVRSILPWSGVFVRTDGEKLRAILGELLTNAIKFTPGGEVELAVEFVSGCTAFVLRDSGPGIDQDDLPLLVRGFRQRQNETLAAMPGRGIGLAVAFRLSALLGAQLTAGRNAEGGATFTLRVPGDAIVQQPGVPATVH